MASNLLPGADRDLSDILTKRVKSRFKSILTDTRVTEMKALKSGIKVKLVGLDLAEPEQTFDRVLISALRAGEFDRIDFVQNPGDMSVRLTEEAWKRWLGLLEQAMHADRQETWTLQTELVNPFERVPVRPGAAGELSLDEAAPMLLLPLGLALRA